MAPGGVLIQGSDGNFYGVSGGGLTNPSCGSAATTDPFYVGCGTVYKITPTGEETVLHLFPASPADGIFPSSLIQGSDGNYYGTTGGGGAHGAGTVFELTPEGVETILYNFGEAPGDGGLPDGLIQGSDGNFYGTTFAGGGVNKAWTVFRLTPQGVATTLYSFSGSFNYSTGESTDGAGPGGQLIQGSDGNFYGVTLEGGVNVNTGKGGPLYGGTVFKVTPEGVETILHSFSGAADGAVPNALVQGSDGNFYGTTSAGGKSLSGTMFQLTPAGVVTVLYSFPKSSVPGPDTNLVQGSDGSFYGASFYGGAHGRGYFFKLILHWEMLLSRPLAAVR
jgi:uncharacterized repeat protein (TIGR03803 family)